ncbi:uncharacterized protein CCOS01_12321, partial [Colletotrichum costaricense]
STASQQRPLLHRILRLSHLCPCPLAPLSRCFPFVACVYLLHFDVIVALSAWPPKFCCFFYRLTPGGLLSKPDSSLLSPSLNHFIKHGRHGTRIPRSSR